MTPSEGTRAAAALKLPNEADRCDLPTVATASLSACVRVRACWCARASTNDRLWEWSLGVKDNNGIEKITQVNKPTQHRDVGQLVSKAAAWK